jgi:hypothetical protein
MVGKSRNGEEWEPDMGLKKRTEATSDRPKHLTETVENHTAGK